MQSNGLGADMEPLPLPLPQQRTPRRDPHPHRELSLELTPADELLLAQIRQWITEPDNGSRILTLTPAVCQVLLREYNKNNRTKKPTAIRNYARDMVDAMFGKTGDTVKFSDAGLLRDGQNRLLACIQAGVPFVTHVVFGIEDALFDRMDSGAGRGGADAIHIHGIPNATMVSAAARWVRLIETRRVKTRDTLRNHQKLALLKAEYQTLPEFTILARRIADVTRQPPGLVLALVYVMHKADTKRAAAYCDAWAGGKWGGPFKPIEFMQTAIAKIKSENANKIDETLRMALMIQAWNTWFENRRNVRPQDIAWSAALAFPNLAGLAFDAQDDGDDDDEAAG